MPEKNNTFSPLPPWQRTDYCGMLRAADAGREVALWGWVATRRDHGSLVFIDLRDREGVVQLVFNPTHDADGTLLDRYVAGITTALGAEATAPAQPVR